MDFEIKGDTLIKYLGTEKDVVIPKEIVVIEENAFAGNDNVERVTIGENVRYLKSEAFSNCINLVEIIFQGEVREIGIGAFSGCTALKELNLPKGIQQIPPVIVSDCENLKRVTIPDGIRIVDSGAFSGFMNCAPIEELVLPDSVEYLGNRNVSNGGYSKKPGDVFFKRIHLGKGLKTIDAFDRNYYEFDSIEFDSDFSLVFDKRYSGPEDEDPFSGKVYSDFSLDADNPYFKYENGLLLSKDGKILYSCLIDNVDEIIVPNGVEKVMGHAFSNVRCDKIIIPGSVNDMRGSFVNAKIGTLVLSEGITDIQSYAFLKSEINDLILPNTLKKMEGLAFMDVKELRTLQLPCNDFTFGKYQMNEKGPKEERTPFWFDPNAGFNDLEYIELINEEGSVLSRLGMPSEKEQRGTKEEYHFVLDDFITSKGNPSGIRSLYRHLKNKNSKLQLLYGLLSMDVLSDDKTKKELVPEIIKNKTELQRMAVERDDEETETTLKELIDTSK